MEQAILRQSGAPPRLALKEDEAKAKATAAAVKRKYPYDVSLLAAVMASCPLGRATQWFVLAGTAALLVVVLPGLPGMGADTSWDARNGVVPGALPGALVPLLERSLGLPRALLALLLLLSAAPLLLLFWLDVRRPRRAGDENSKPAAAANAADAAWARVLPAAAHALVFRAPGDKDCYVQMFSEAGATGSARLAAGYLVAAPGNTYSNLFYWLTGLSVLASTLGGAALGVDPSRATPYWLPDAVYGALVTALAFFSTGWHSTNRPFFHYPDLATMECAIAYLIVRVPCAAAGAPAAACLAIYAVVIALIFQHKRRLCDASELHWGCPFAGRWRLFHNGTPGNEDLGVAGVAIYAALPVLYLALPFGTQILALRNSGSVVAHSLAVNALALGWGYRMLERFCLDGNPLMNWILRNTREGTGAARTLCAAIASPTAILHWTTGLTLLFAYAGARTLEQQN